METKEELQRTKIEFSYCGAWEIILKIKMIQKFQLHRELKEEMYNPNVYSKEKFLEMVTHEGSFLVTKMSVDKINQNIFYQ